MRPILVVSAVVLTAVAGCSSNASSAAGPDSTGSNGNTFNVAVDSAQANRTIPAGSSSRVSVTVTLGGQPVLGVPVSWRPTTGSGVVSDTVSGTDSSGVASTTWTINDTVKVNSLEAIVGTSTATLVANGIAGQASALVKESADSVAVIAGASTLLSVRVTDRVGNPVSGVTVAWTATGGSLSAGSATSGASGAVESTFTTPSTPGTSLVTAAVAGIGSVVFRITGL